MRYSPEASAQMAQEEKERQKAADHVMTIGTAYILGATRSYSGADLAAFGARSRHE